MKRVVYVIELDVEDPTQFDEPLGNFFGTSLVDWNSYVPEYVEEDDLPIRLNIDLDGVEEV